MLNVNKTKLHSKKERRDKGNTKRLSKYQKLGTKTVEDKYSSYSEEEKELPQKREKKRITDENKQDNEIALNEIKLGNINEKDSETERGIYDDSEDINFRNIEARKYLERRGISKVARPDFNQNNYGKRSTLEYAKDIAYFNQELSKFGGQRILKESEKRIRQKDLEAQINEKYRNEEESSEEIDVEKSEDSFERKKRHIRELMCKAKERVLLPSFKKSMR